MAFLGRPTLVLGSPSRPSPSAPGTVRIEYTIPLFIDVLERCFVKHCDEALPAPMFELTAEIWSSDKNEPRGTFPITRDQVLFPVAFHPGGASTTPFRRISGEEIAGAFPVPGSASAFQLTISDGMTVAENALNEDWGPFPPPGAPAKAFTRDEVFLRVYLASMFSAWQRISSIDSEIATGQFFGP